MIPPANPAKLYDNSIFRRESCAINTKSVHLEAGNGCYTPTPNPVPTNVRPQPPATGFYSPPMSDKTLIVYGDGDRVVLRNEQVDEFLAAGRSRSQQGVTPDPLRVATSIKQ